MSLDLKKQTFLFGNIDLIECFWKKVDLNILYSFYSSENIDILKQDRSLPWRYMNNFKILLRSYENYLLNNLRRFNELIDFLYKTILFYENFLDKKNHSFINPKTNYDFFKINTIVLINLFRNKLILYKKNNSSIMVSEFEDKFKNFSCKDNDFVYDYVCPYDDIKWSSKWKLLSKNREITFDNIDIYLDSYFKNCNMYYNSTMANNIKTLSERLYFLKNNAPLYLNSIDGNLYKVTETLFSMFPYSIVYRDYINLFDFEKTYVPQLIRNKTKENLLILNNNEWILSILPEFLSTYLLGLPVISMDIPDTKQINFYIELLLEKGEKDYFDYIKNTYNKKYIDSVSFAFETGNLTDDDKILDLCYNDICDFNQDDISGLFNNNVIHYFTSKEFRNIVKNQENPYNRQAYPNLNKIIENLKFKNKIKKNLINKGLDVELDGTMMENFQEIKQKISSDNVIHYFPHVENNTDIFYRPLLEILLNSI